MSEPGSSYASEPEHPAPESIDAITADRKKRRARLLVGAVVTLVVVGGGGFGLVRYQEAEQEKAVATAWSAMSRCVVGGDLPEAERPSQRFRNLQLVAMAMSDAERVLEGSPKAWPMSCAPLAHTVHEVLRTGSMGEPGKELATSAEAHAKALDEAASFSNDLTNLVDQTFDRAREAKLRTIVGVAAPAAPMPQAPLTATFLGTVEPLSRASFTLAGAFTDAHPAGALRVLVEEKGVERAPFLCTFDPKEATASCKTLPPSLAQGHGLRLLGTADDDSAPLVFAGERGTAGIYRADTGVKVGAMYSYGGYAKADGSSAVLGYSGHEHDLLIARRTAEGPVPRTRIEVDFELGNLYYSSQLLWNAMLLRGVNKQKERRLYAATLDFRGEPFKDLGSVGILPEPGLITGSADEPPHIAGCRSKEAMVVRVRGYENDFMSFQIGGKWTPPISPDVPGGILSCHGTEAVITRLEQAASTSTWKTSVAQCNCTSAGCVGGRVQMEKFLKGHYEFAPKDNHVDAVDLDGKLLVVWAAGERGGVRMRLAKVDQIEQAEDIILFDDLVRDGQVGKLSTLFDLRLFSRDGFAVLLLNTVAGVHALRIDPGGKVAPVTVKWG
ncbi:MAG: hypothetical protein R3F14_24740 [Polyangiaceae bacterium]